MPSYRHSRAFIYDPTHFFDSPSSYDIRHIFKVLTNPRLVTPDSTFLASSMFQTFLTLK